MEWIMQFISKKDWVIFWLYLQYLKQFYDIRSIHGVREMSQDNTLKMWYYNTIGYLGEIGEISHLYFREKIEKMTQ